MTLREEFEPGEAEEIRKEVVDDGLKPERVAEKHRTSTSIVRRIVATLEGARTADKFSQPLGGLHIVHREEKD
jgi:hypothetical protein